MVDVSGNEARGTAPENLGEEAEGVGGRRFSIFEPEVSEGVDDFVGYPDVMEECRDVAHKHDLLRSKLHNDMVE